ncbi:MULTISPECIES: bifunctional 5,10-methylenetetrahydrofolate dehydrogenase/5,10-methenyltetrahydrofolate cyclohydrolase [unclassified Granulicatella]|uniref:bifunctional 5,10-methylenetetrahydrofolate dehydrogenase/5,10-methenyltetrahydrofolate cyclohydrolase n=1 Tax=unclassified Granulicatella TaxID=2630493 RepID=UPI001073F398|nr:MULTISPECIES: bifunctional 5,10-methylenetetrahydrofolate dehydrogenase/5,10-methenyltetrahydrofolate cyclohydrolase [unclassified Granulicatella]MBF0780402.1 bifunctional 5,10-methylenetetrahydrofolate dehydrogenase/5,10-methenyltetrahydrofolate cyclohydrolase [Granulicatella sp. 19428wC4_WM01]TFU95441.1 bifunctional 5,10-methylenetetrahydrofolate dehydrogenase/5,10-methenyltetrahydrofolate cyclohydrolase [Granulicatella sp. WM01]
MSVTLLNGRALAQEIKCDLSKKVEKLKEEKGVVPKLVVLLVGDDCASRIYARNKEKMALQIGFESVIEEFPNTVTQEELLARIHYYNHAKDCHAILVQLPLPEHLDKQKILQAIDYHKDVDGFHPMNVGNLLLNNPTVFPCTPQGILTLLDYYNIALTGKTAVVVGRSTIVGKPMAQMLLQRDATVIMAHSRTENLKAITQQADILIVAVGKKHFITPDHVKQGAVVVDVGTNEDENGKLVGDVMPDVAQIASAMTPVPGGVGPMTIAMLLNQTYQLALEHISCHQTPKNN